MRALRSLLFLVMAGWLLVSAALRIMIQLNSGSDLDALPFISGALGLVALVAFLVGGADRHHEHPAG